MDSDNDDPFCDAPGTRLAQATRTRYWFGWRRFLGFLAISEPSALEAGFVERLTLEGVRSYVTHLAETNSPRSVGMRIDELYQAARIMLPHQDWSWLKSIKTRLHTAAPARGRSGPVI